MTAQFDCGFPLDSSSFSLAICCLEFDICLPNNTISTSVLRHTTVNRDGLSLSFFMTWSNRISAFVKISVCEDKNVNHFGDISVNKAIDLHDKVLFPRSLEIGFHPFIRVLSASAPRIRWTSQFAKPRCRYQPFRANSKISYKVGSWHASASLRRETAVETTLCWPDYRLQDFQGPFGYWSELVFPPSRSMRPKRASLQGTPRCEPPPKERAGIWARVVKYWNKLPASVVAAPSVNVFKKRS